jgi:hypothetical protein
MSDKTLSQRLRELRRYVSGEQWLAFDQCIAQVEAQEAQAPISWRDIKVTKGQETYPLGTLVKLLEHERDTALAALKSMEAQAGELSDEVIQRIVDEERRNLTPLSIAVTGDPPDDPEQEEKEHDEREAFLEGLEDGLRYARDMGYLRPSQAIGEQTPVVIKDSEVFTACETYADNYLIEGRITTSPKAMRMALKKFMEGRSPMSSEAREKAVEALKAAHREAQESRKHFSPSDLDRIHIESLVVQLSEALSALRG